MLCLIFDSFTMFNIEKVHPHEYGDIYRENMEARLKKDKSSGRYWRGKHKNQSQHQIKPCIEQIVLKKRKTTVTYPSVYSDLKCKASK